MSKNIGKNVTQLTITKFINLTIGIVNAMILSRFRTLEEFGTYSQLNMVIALFTTVIMMGLPNSINYFIAKAESNQERTFFLSNYYTISTILSILTGLVLLIGIPYIANYFNNELIYSFAFYLLLIPWINIIGGSIGNLFIVYNKVKLLSVYNIASSLLMIAALIASIIFSLSFMQYMYIIVCLQILITLFVYVIASKLAGGLHFSINKFLVKTIFEFSIPLGLATIVGTISIELDKLMIGYFFDTETMAIYTNAAREMPVTIISSSITAVLMPHLVRLLKQNKNEEAIYLWRESTSLSYTFICFFAAALFIFAPEVISLLYSDKYLPGVSVFRIYNIVLLLRCTYFGIVLNSIGKTKFIFYSSIASLGVNIMLNYFFYLIFGLTGPAIATFVSILLVGILQLIVTSRQVNIQFKKIFMWKDMLFITIINIIMGTAFYLIKKNISLEIMVGEIMESIILGVFWCGLYGLIMLKSIKQRWSNLNSF